MSNTRNMETWPQHPFKLSRDELVIAGHPVHQIAKDIGSTPFYVYDSSVIEAAIQGIRSSMPVQIKVYYAVKANPMPDLLSHMKDQVDGFDIASAGELSALLQAGADPSTISFAGPGKTDAELLAAVNAGIMINVESENECRRIEQIGQQTGHRPDICLRINPNFSLKASGMKMGGGPQQFGVDEEQAPGLLKKIGHMDLSFNGLHIYTGSQNLHAAHIINGQNAIFQLAESLAQHCPEEIRSFNIGGGFGIPYFTQDRALDIDAVGRNLSQLIDQYSEQLGHPEIIIELGRYLVGEAGVYVTRVVDKKVSRGEIFLITDGGMHHHLAASGNLGQFIRKNFPIVNPGHVLTGERETVNITGPLCTPLDLLGHRVELAKTEVGDLIAILQSGAYGLTASPIQFLSHQPPGELFL